MKNILQISCISLSIVAFPFFWKLTIFSATRLAILLLKEIFLYKMLVLGPRLTLVTKLRSRAALRRPAHLLLGRGEHLQLDGSREPHGQVWRQGRTLPTRRATSGSHWRGQKKIERIWSVSHFFTEKLIIKNSYFNEFFLQEVRERWKIAVVGEHLQKNSQLPADKKEMTQLACFFPANCLTATFSFFFLRVAFLPKLTCFTGN